MMALWLLKGPSMWAASATALYALGVSVAVFFGLLWMEKYRLQLRVGTWVTIFACVVGFGIITPLVGGSTVTGFSAAVGRNATLTGRTEIWASLLPDVMRQPFLGYGFGSFWTMTRRAGHDIGEAHSGYLEDVPRFGIRRLDRYIVSVGGREEEPLSCWPMTELGDS